MFCLVCLQQSLAQFKCESNPLKCLVCVCVAHLEANLALLAAKAGQHEKDEGEEAREGDCDHSQGGRPRQLTQRSAICRSHTEYQL